MNYFELIKLLYPTIKETDFELGYNEETEIQINRWDFSSPQPTIEYLQTFRQKMASFDDIKSAAVIALKFLQDTDYKALRVNEGYEMSQQDKDAREAARVSMRALMNFKLN